jgi:integrase/recombinase XerD
MNKSNAENVRIKREYFAHLKGPRRQSEASIDAAAKALSRFASYTCNKNFKTFRKEQAIGFTAHLSQEVIERTGEPLSKATLLSTLNALKAFFTWLSQQRGFKSRFAYLDAEYFSLSLKDTAIAKAVRERPVPSIEQIRHVALKMPHETDVEKRDRALVALALMTGARDDAIASLRLRHMDLDAGFIEQDARVVRTKFSKTIRTYFVPLGTDIRQIFEGWVQHLRSVLLWGPDDPLFPRTRIVTGDDWRFEADGLERAGWKSSGPIRAIFRKAFEAAGVPYFNPHSFRHALARHGQKICVTLEDHKAFSQNLGHASIKTTEMHYGSIPTERQGQLIRGLGKREKADPTALSLARDLLERLGGPLLGGEQSG